MNFSSPAGRGFRALWTTTCVLSAGSLGLDLLVSRLSLPHHPREPVIATAVVTYSTPSETLANGSYGGPSAKAVLQAVETIANEVNAISFTPNGQGLLLTTAPSLRSDDSVQASVINLIPSGSAADVSFTMSSPKPLAKTLGGHGFELPSSLTKSPALSFHSPGMAGRDAITLCRADGSCVPVERNPHGSESFPSGGVAYFDARGKSVAVPLLAQTSVPAISGAQIGPVGLANLPKGATAVAFAKDGRVTAAFTPSLDGASGGILRFNDHPKSKKNKAADSAVSIAVPCRLTHLQFVADGKYLAGRVEVSPTEMPYWWMWDARTGFPVNFYALDRQDIITFGPDGRYLAYRRDVDGGGRIRRYCVIAFPASSQEIAVPLEQIRTNVFHGPEETLQLSGCFSPDGKYLIALTGENFRRSAQISAWKLPAEL